MTTRPLHLRQRQRAIRLKLDRCKLLMNALRALGVEPTVPRLMRMFPTLLRSEAQAAIDKGAKRGH